MSPHSWRPCEEPYENAGFEGSQNTCLCGLRIKVFPSERERVLSRLHALLVFPEICLAWRRARSPSVRETRTPAFISLQKDRNRRVSAFSNNFCVKRTSAAKSRKPVRPNQSPCYSIRVTLGLYPFAHIERRERISLADSISDSGDVIEAPQDILVHLRAPIHETLRLCRILRANSP